MNELEVVRLRRLRESALRSRAIASGMATYRHAHNEPLLLHGAGACWRIVRAVSGQLRAHPDVRYQADVGIAARWRHRALAALQIFGGSTPSAVHSEYLILMRQLLRQLDDARILTRSADLSDTLGRARSEINDVVDRLMHKTSGAVRAPCPRGRECLIIKLAPGLRAPPFEGEWPYLSSAPRLNPGRCEAPNRAVCPNIA